VRYEAWVPYRHGKPRWIQATYVPDADAAGRVQGFVALVQDVTEQKGADVALRESEEKFRRIVETANEGIWLLDENALVTFVNPRMSDLIGYTPEEMIGRPKWDFLLGRDRERVKQLFARRRAGISEQLDVCFQHRDGRPVWMLMAARPVLDETGVFRGTLDMFTDVTERKRLEAELEARVAELASADRRKDEFIATLSHELRNPLAPIRNAVALLQQVESSDPAVDGIRSLLDRQVRQLTRLIDDLLDAARVSRNQLELRRQRVDLAEVVRSALESSLPVIEEAGHALEMELPDGPVPLYADPTRLAQVLTNLLNNAAKYTPRGGRIALAATTGDGEVTLSVRDSGIGIAPEDLPRVFELFAQVSTPLDQPDRGLGIGLALVRALVELHGGKVEVESEGLGRGSEFRVRLPLAGPPARAAASSAQSAPSGRKRGALRVLVVDDNRDAAESLALLLRLRGHEVRQAHDGFEALAAATAFHPDAVLLDIGLPGLNGYDVARRMRQEQWSRRALLIAVTGWGQEGDKQRSREAGIDHHFTKPVDVGRLAELFESVDAKT
jgi:PAS domain S-box-containing protein